MGELADVKDAIAIAEAYVKVGKHLNGARTVLLRVDNHTLVPFRRVSDTHSSGGFGVPPEPLIPPGKSNIFGSQSRAWSVATGAIGSMTYTSDRFAKLVIKWSNPFAGDNSCSIQLEGPVGVEAQKACGAGNDAQMRFSVLEKSEAYAEGALVKGVSRPEVYVIYGGAKFWIPSGEEFQALGFEWAWVQALSDQVMDSLPAVPRDGTLLKERSNPRVYVVRGGTRLWIRSPERFDQLGFSWPAIRMVPDGSLEPIAYGGEA